MTVLDASTQPFLFPEPLREGVILARPNRFIMDVDFDLPTMRSKSARFSTRRP